ncbi:hypothetical protein SUGI_1052240 [Cryptomeria japonica]|nr:hypothetical protein SUGI_1052240 [Cryptomeria japonica]
MGCLAPALNLLWPLFDPHSQNIIPDFLHEGNSDKTITGSNFLKPINFRGIKHNDGAATASSLCMKLPPQFFLMDR